MFWRAFAQAMYGNPVKCGYDGEAQDNTVLPLDPIDPSLVGGARTIAIFRAAQRMSLTVLVAIVGLVMSVDVATPPDWITGFEAPKGPPRRVGEKYVQHMIELHRVGLIARASRQTIKFWSGYFAVKKGHNTSRSIFNAKLLSMLCPAPHVVNLIDAQGIVRRMVAHGQETGGRFEVVTGDLRHWFHQIDSPEHLRALFGLRSRGTDWVWTGLPMGWSWSPLVAQACAWGFLAYRHQSEKALLDEAAFKGAQLPTWVRTPAGGFVVVYYDNYLVVTPDANEAAEWRRRIERNSVELGVRIKEGSHQCLSTADFCREGFDYLGIHFQGVKDRESDRRPLRLIWWPAKAALWQVELEECHEQLPSFSCRQVAQLIGRGVFGLIIGGKPLPQTENGRRLLAVARTIGQRAHAKGWEAPAGDLAAAAWACLEHVCQLRHEPHQAELSPKEIRPATPWVLTTDASKSGYGWVAFEGVEGRLIPEEAPDRYAFKWQEATAKQHIFLLEFHACLTALRVWRKRHPHERVVVVVDNAAVAFALRNGFSNNVVAMRLMESHAEDLAAMEDVVLVVSQDNPADCPSRGSLSDFGDRTERLERALNARRQGWNWASGPCSKYISEGKRPADRHLYVERLHDETEEEEERAEDVMLPLM